MGRAKMRVYDCEKDGIPERLISGNPGGLGQPVVSLKFLSIKSISLLGGMLILPLPFL